MTEATETIRIVAGKWFLHAIAESTIGCFLLGMTGMLAAHGEAWHAAGSGIAAGAFLSAACFTAVRAFTWRREADKREGN